MFSHIKRWYEGETKIHEVENDPRSLVVIMPMIYTEYHWSAKIARAVVRFYMLHWQWVWSTMLAVLGLVLALK